MPNASRLVSLTIALGLASISLSCACQSIPPSVLATPDGDVTIPVETGVLGQRDPAAVEELTEHLAAVGGILWGGMKGVGEITYGPDMSGSYAATLSNNRMNEFRLDAADKSGQMSIRIHGIIGKIQSADGTTSLMPTETALTGLFPFEIARIILSSADATSFSILDHGNTTVGASLLHRISVESRSLGYSAAARVKATHVVDLYFDTKSHLLAKSAVYDTAAGSRAVKFIYVVSYSDYRSVGGSLVPFRYTETMEGQPYWTLQLTDVQLNPTFTANYFEF